MLQNNLYTPQVRADNFLYVLPLNNGDDIPFLMEGKKVLNWFGRNLPPHATP
jgi:hypothetical protein